MELKSIGIIIIVLVSVIALGCVESQSSKSTSTLTSTLTSTPTPLNTPIPTPTQPKIEMVVLTPSQILPTINDMPSGSIKGAEKSNDTYALRDFVFTGYLTQVVKYETFKFSSIDESKQKYKSVINDYSNYKLDDVNMGDEGVGFEIGNSLATVVFRKANVVVQVKFVGQYTITLRDAKSYAKLVNTPTSSVIIEQKTNSESGFKLVAYTKTLENEEMWDIGNGYSLELAQIFPYDTIQIWFRILKDGKAIHGVNYVLIDGRVKFRKMGDGGFIYTDDNVLNYNNIFYTTIESISDTEVTLRDTYIKQ